MVRVVLALCATVALVGCGGSASATCVEVPGGRGCVDVIDPADRPAAPTDRVPLVDEDGELGLPDLAGRTVVVNFWASWCGPCRSEQPDLNEAHRRLAGEDVAFLGVALQDTPVNAAAHVREFAIPYPSLFDPTNAYASRFEGISPQAIPSTIVVDARGRVAARIFGAVTVDELVAVVDHVARPVAASYGAVRR